jgi:hypothetical protein
VLLKKSALLCSSLPVFSLPDGVHLYPVPTQRLCREKISFRLDLDLRVSPKSVGPFVFQFTIAFQILPVQQKMKQGWVVLFWLKAVKCPICHLVDVMSFISILSFYISPRLS